MVGGSRERDETEVAVRPNRFVSPKVRMLTPRGSRRDASGNPSALVAAGSGRLRRKARRSTV
jgi:hypothetical protein